MTGVWCGIPVYNNAGTIADVVGRCLEQIPNVIVIDDGSTDADLRELLKPLNVTVIRHPTNQGKGVALKTAFDYAASRGGDFIITLDGDGQHFPEDIPNFLARLSPDTLLIGARKQVVGIMPPSSRFGREFSDFWICVETGQTVRDTQSGFRAYPLRKIQSLHLSAKHYNMEVEVVTKALWANMHVENVPIRVRYFSKTEAVSSFRPFLDNLRISRVHTRLVLRQLLPIPHDDSDDDRAKRKSFMKENSSPLGLAASAGVSALLGILLWPWGVIPVAFLAWRLHFNKPIAAAILLLCAPRAIAAFCLKIGHIFAGPSWAWFVGTHIVAFIISPILAVLVYAVARRFRADP
jgi:glycosyltransferase involved in cell wall biosynthesis